jgi:hypothetical protein
MFDAKSILEGRFSKKPVQYPVLLSPLSAIRTVIVYPELDRILGLAWWSNMGLIFKLACILPNFQKAHVVLDESSFTRSIPGSSFGYVRARRADRRQRSGYPVGWGLYACSPTIELPTLGRRGCPRQCLDTTAVSLIRTQDITWGPLETLRRSEDNETRPFFYHIVIKNVSTGERRLVVIHLQLPERSYFFHDDRFTILGGTHGLWNSIYLSVEGRAKTRAKAELYSTIQSPNKPCDRIIRVF